MLLDNNSKNVSILQYLINVNKFNTESHKNMNGI